MNSKTLYMISFLIILLMFSVAPVESQRKLNIVTTTQDLQSIAEAVGGDHVSVTSIGKGAEDPHFLQAKPSFMLKAKDADLWIRIGLELEIGYESLILEGSRNHRIAVGQPGHLDASEGVMLLDVPQTKVDRSLGDVHPFGNPHYWLDPYNGRIIAEHISARLSQLDPSHRADYRTNLTAFQSRLDAGMFGPQLVKELGGDALWKSMINHTFDTFIGNRNPGGWAAKMLPHTGKKIVIYHRSWNYFTSRFGLVIAGELEPKPGIPPSGSHLEEIMDIIKSQGVKVILEEPFFSRRASDDVAARTGAKVLVCANSVGGQPEATDYIALINLIVNRLSNTL
jgi:zinc/manganese transport system substrate-binding protein